MDNTASGVPDGSRTSFSARRVRLAMLLQCAPLLCALSAITDAVQGPAPPAWGTLGGWIIGILGISALFAGVGYAVLGRRRRFWCASILGACAYIALQLKLVSGDSAVGIPAAVFFLGLAGVTAADLWRLRRGGDAAADPAFGLAEIFGARPGAAEIFGTIVVCVLAACFILVAAWAVVEAVGCVTTVNTPGGTCDLP